MCIWFLLLFNSNFASLCRKKHWKPKLLQNCQTTIQFNFLCWITYILFRLSDSYLCHWNHINTVDYYSINQFKTEALKVYSLPMKPSYVETICKYDFKKSQSFAFFFFILPISNNVYYNLIVNQYVILELFIQKKLQKWTHSAAKFEFQDGKTQSINFFLSHIRPTRLNRNIPEFISDKSRHMKSCTN